MRWIIGLLLVANLVYFLWGNMHRSTADHETVLRPADVGTLRLLSESSPGAARPGPTPPAPLPLEPEMTPGLPPRVAPATPAPPEPLAAHDPVAAQDPAAIVPAVAAPTPEPGAASVPAAPFATLAADAPPGAEPSIARQGETPVAAVASLPVPDICSRVGPFAGEDAAQDFAAQIAAEVTTASVQTTAQARVTGYFAMLPPAATRDEGKRSVARLREAGITDVWLFVSGPLRNAVSLGLFTARANAQRLADRVRARGFSVEVRERESEVETFWVDLEHPADRDPADFVPPQWRSAVASCPSPGR